MSEAWENSAGAGVDPKGSCVNMVAMLSGSFVFVSFWFVFQVAMHFEDIVGVVCNRRYAFSMSTLLSSIRLFGLWNRMLCIKWRKR